VALNRVGHDPLIRWLLKMALKMKQSFPSLNDSRYYYPFDRGAAEISSHLYIKRRSSVKQSLEVIA
jgi:hypothetical protein